jgi:hypothetical protein
VQTPTPPSSSSNEQPRVLVYTANIAGRDKIHGQAEQTMECDWLYITDDPYEHAPPPWITVRVRRDPDVHPNMQAKWYRTHPPFNDEYDYCIWIDAGMEMTSHTCVAEAVATCPDDGLAVWQHPRRDCIYDEIDASLGSEGQSGRYAALPLREQGAAYQAEGYPAHNGLYATGTLVWTPASAKLIGGDWYDECVKWGYQDQVCFPVICWRAGLAPATFNVGQTNGRFNHRMGWWGNSWMRLHNHVPGTGGDE